MRGTKTVIERMNEADRIKETDNQLMQIDQLTADNSRLKAEVERLGESLDFCRDWYAVRLERLSQFIREEIPEPQKTRYFSIIANGTADVNEPPTYASIINTTKHQLDEARQQLHQRDEVIVALRALCDKLELVNSSSEFQSVWTLAWSHFGDYKGPSYAKEFEDAKAALTTLNQISQVAP